MTESGSTELWLSTDTRIYDWERINGVLTERGYTDFWLSADQWSYDLVRIHRFMTERSYTDLWLRADQRSYEWVRIHRFMTEKRSTELWLSVDQQSYDWAWIPTTFENNNYNTLNNFQTYVTSASICMSSRSRQCPSRTMMLFVFHGMIVSLLSLCALRRVEEWKIVKY